MTDDYFPQRSPDGLAALDIFYDDFNDIRFFVEDADQENLYEIVLRKLFPELRVARIFPLGGKQAVLSRCAAEAQQGSRPPAIYIVDKDFDDFLGCQLTRPSLYYLDRYCIENYFPEPEAIIEVVIESLPKLKRTEVGYSLDLTAKIHEIAESMRPLFQLFYCVQRFDLGLKNCALAPEEFCCKSRRWSIDGQAISRYRQQVIQAAVSTPYAAVLIDPLANPIVSQLHDQDVHSIVSGKHICALLFHYIKSKYNLGTITFESFLFRLAKNATLSSLQSLADSIRATTTPLNRVINPSTQ